VPSQAYPRSAGSAAFGAAAALLILTANVAADASHRAAAQSRLEAEYVATLDGFTVGRGNLVVDIAPDQYSAAATGTTTGLLRFFTGGRGNTATHGIFAGGAPSPKTYAATIATDKSTDDVRMTLANGNVKEYTVDPPVTPHPDRIPVSDADRRGVTDPMSSTINHIAGSGNLIAPESCNRKVPIFDGRLRYDLESEFKRVETVKTEKGYEGPVLVCAVYFRPIAGYVPERSAIKYLIALRDAELWQAPIAGTRFLVPIRLVVPTPIGTGVLRATQFIAQSPTMPPLPSKTQ